MTGRAPHKSTLTRLLVLMAMTAIAFSQIGWAQDDEDYLWSKEYYFGDGRCEKEEFSGSKKNGQDLYVKDDQGNFGFYMDTVFDFERHPTNLVFTGEAHFTGGLVIFEDYTELAGLDAEALLLPGGFIYGLTARIEGFDAFELGTHKLHKSWPHTFADKPIPVCVILGVEVEAFITIGYDLDARLDPDFSADPLGLELKATATLSPFVQAGIGVDIGIATVGPVLTGRPPGLEFVIDLATFYQQPIQLVSYIEATGPSLAISLEAWDYVLTGCGDHKSWESGAEYCTWIERTLQYVTQTVRKWVWSFWGWITRSTTTTSAEYVNLEKSGYGVRTRDVLASVAIKTWQLDPLLRGYIVKYDPFERNEYDDDDSTWCLIGPVRESLVPTKEWVTVDSVTISLPGSDQMRWSKSRDRSYTGKEAFGYVFEVHSKRKRGRKRDVVVKAKKSVYDQGLGVRSWAPVGEDTLGVKWITVWQVCKGSVNPWSSGIIEVNDNLRFQVVGVEESHSGSWYNPSHVYFDLKIEKQEFKLP